MHSLQGVCTCEPSLNPPINWEPRLSRKKKQLFHVVIEAPHLLETGNLHPKIMKYCTFYKGLIYTNHYDMERILQ